MVYTTRRVVTLASWLPFLHPDLAVNLFLSVGSLGLQSPSAPNLATLPTGPLAPSARTGASRKLSEVKADPAVSTLGGPTGYFVGGMNGCSWFCRV
jgi:hypothetical protein